MDYLLIGKVTFIYYYLIAIYINRNLQGQIRSCEARGRMVNSFMSLVSLVVLPCPKLRSCLVRVVMFSVKLNKQIIIEHQCVRRPSSSLFQCSNLLLSTSEEGGVNVSFYNDSRRIIKHSEADFKTKRG